MNCGKKLWTEPLSLDIKKPIHKDEMYFSFFELNNEKVIYVCFTQNFIDEKPTTTEVGFAEKLTVGAGTLGVVGVEPPPPPPPPHEETRNKAKKAT